MAALEQDLTPDDMKHLTPQQSAAVLSKERGRIDVALAGVNSIIQSRKDRKIEDEERAVKQFEIFVESGVPTDQLPDGFLDNLDAVWGLPKDTHANVYKSRTTEDEQEKFVAELQIQSAILGMVNSTPLGEEFTIGDHTYTGLSIANMMTGTE